MNSFTTIMPPPVENQGVHILDHGKTVDGKLKYQDDVTTYGYNIKRYNKLKVGDFVLFRHPGKLTKDRKFEIYAGGYVESISEPDEEGNVVASLSHSFEIIPALRQGDSFIESFSWQSKNKIPNTWEHFWNQYGMNSISYEDCINLMANANCVPIGNGEVVPQDEDLSSEDLEGLHEEDFTGFTATLDDSENTKRANPPMFTGLARKPNYEKIQKAKNKIGALGEAIILDLLTEEAKKNGCKLPDHVSKEEGDGLGYDIRSFDINGKEIHNEVKSTTQNKIDGFEMSYNEVAASKDPNFKYRIYRVYALDMATKTCKYKVYEGAVTDDKYNLVSKSIAVFLK